MWRCCGILVYLLESHAESPGSNPTIAMHFCPSARQFISTLLLSTQVYKWGPGRMRQMAVFEFASAIMTMCHRLL